MADAVVGALRAVLGLDTAAFEEGAKRAQESAKGFFKSVTEIATGVGLEKFVEKATESLVHFAKSGIETADNLDKMSQRFGVPIEQLSSFRLAADVSGVSLETFGRGLKNFSVELNKAATGGADPFVSAINAIGLSVAKLKGSDQVTAFKLVSDQFAKMEDGAIKTSLAAAIFGKRMGPDLIPLLNLGASGIAKWQAQAESVGLVIDEKVGKAADNFVKQMTVIGFVAEGVSLKAMAPLADAMTRVANSMVEWVNKSNLVTTASTVLVRAIALIVDNLGFADQILGIFLAKLVIEKVISFASGILAAAKAFASMTTAMLLSNAASLVTIARIATLAALVLYFTGNLPAFTEQVKKVAGVVAEMVPEGTAETFDKLAKIMGLDLKALTGDVSGLGHASEDAEDKIKKLKPPPWDPKSAEVIKKVNEEVVKLGIQARETAGEFSSLPPGFVQTAQGLGLIKASGEGLKETLSLSTAEARKLADAMFVLEAAKLTKEFLTPWQQYEEQLKRINALLLNTKISQDVAALAAVKAAAEMRAKYADALSGIAGNVANAFASVAAVHKEFAGVAKAAAIVSATVNAYASANAAFLATIPLGLPFAIAAAAAAVAAGLANVYKIAATPANFATGGSFTVGGGMGGPDTQLISFAATPGEIVDIRKPGSARSNVTEINLRPPRMKSLFTDHVRDLVDVLNSAAPDGYRLKVS